MDGNRAASTVRQELQVVSHLFETARREWGMEALLNPLKNIRKPSVAMSVIGAWSPGNLNASVQSWRGVATRMRYQLSSLRLKPA